MTDLADKYFKLFTGNKIEDLLARIVTRETEEELDSNSFEEEVITKGGGE